MRILLVEGAVFLGEAVRYQITEDGHAVDYFQFL